MIARIAIRILIGIFVSFSFLIAAYAVGPSVWSVDSRAEVMRGDAHGVSIDDSGAITLAPKLTEVYRTEQPYIWSSAVDAAGNIYLGTGSDGKIFKVDAAGKGSMLTDLTELNVSALAIGKNGELFAGTSPDGKVYRVDASGKAGVYFDPKQKYIWSLAVMSDGSLAVGTGENGRIYRVRSANATPESSLLFDSSETHIISLAVDKTGNLYAGTDPGGIVLRFGADGKPFALLDSPLREIHDVAVGADGSVYALALGESASAKPIETPAGAAENKPAAENPSPAPIAQPAKSRYDLSNAKSAVYRMLPDGGNDLIWSSTSVTGFSLVPHANGVLIGTSDKGRIYSVTNDARETLALQTDANQISTLVDAHGQFLATSSNQGNLYRFGSDSVAEGTYQSSVLDAKAVATWGRLWWRSTGGVQLQTRSGNTDKPDETWSPWSDAATNQSVQVSSPKARYLQWRAVLKNGTPAARLDEVDVAYQPRNIAPEVLNIQVLPTNVGLAANPAPQIDPNILLSGLDPSTFGIPVTVPPPRRIFQRGATSLQWTAEDRNGDKLVYDVLYKQVGDANFRLLRENIDENFITIDGQSLADGRYIFKIVAKDSPSNPAGAFLTGERVTEPVEIDNTPPVITAGQPIVTGDSARVTFSASDKASYLTRAEYSVNGGEWHIVYADDGISDSPNETYTVQIPVTASGEYIVTLRAFDVNGNSGNARAVVRK
jgi:sugar lactone lactonase YvrE